MNKLTEITVWLTVGKNRAFVFHHMEYGHSRMDAPQGLTEFQKKAWSGNVWKKQFAYLDEGNNVVLDTEFKKTTKPCEIDEEEKLELPPGYSEECIGKEGDQFKNMYINGDFRNRDDR